MTITLKKAPVFTLKKVPAATLEEVPVGANFKVWERDIKSGQYIVGYDWSENQLERVRPLETLDGYIPDEAFIKLVKVTHKRLGRVLVRKTLGMTGIDAIDKDYINVMICGRPDTGKTTTADALSAATGLPIVTVKVTKDTEEDTFEGMDTAFFDAYTNGGIVVLEDINLADPEVIQSAIGRAVEYPFILNRDGYQEVRRHPLCVIIATMNPGARGARELNEAFISRFSIWLRQ